MDRRRFIQFGALSVASATLAAACGIGPETPEASEATTTTEPSESDLIVLRTASSIEEFAVDVYTTLIDSGVVTTAGLAEALELFRRHHTEHSQLFQGETRKLGAEAFADPNPALQSLLGPRIASARTEPDALRLALDVERAAAASFQLYTTELRALYLRSPMMSIAGAEARHVATLASAVVLPPYPPTGLQTTDGSIPPSANL